MKERNLAKKKKKNASVHHCNGLKESASKTGYNRAYLPPCLLFLNLTEGHWNKLKAFFRRKRFNNGRSQND
jgi:hypothetical protein